MVGTILLYIGSIVMLGVLWWCIKCYFGNMFATFIVIISIAISIAISIVILNWINEPTKDELKQFHEKRKGVGAV